MGEPRSGIIDHAQLYRFISESNRIEGITRRPRKAELRMTEVFLALRSPRVADVAGLVSTYQPDAVIRNQPHLNVRVGGHIAPQGGELIVASLASLLNGLPNSDPYATHVEYEKLHPFTDGNGRSGRAIWAWQMLRRQKGLPLGFLHQFYYQTLAARDAALKEIGGAP